MVLYHDVDCIMARIHVGETV